MVCLEKKCELLGMVKFAHSNYSGYERVAFYLRGEKVYPQTTFFDPFERIDLAMELRLCELDKKEVAWLLQKKEVADFRRFYWN